MARCWHFFQIHAHVLLLVLAALTPTTKSSFASSTLTANPHYVIFGDSITAGSDDANDGTRIATTSPTSLQIGVAQQSLTVDPGLPINPGEAVSIFSSADANNPTNYMQGTVTAYSAATGLLTANITNAYGSGVYSSWRVAVTNPAIPCTTLCYTYNDLGYASWVDFYTGNRVLRVPNGAVGTSAQGNFGIAGDLCFYMDTPLRLQPVLNSGADFVIIECGINDMFSSTPNQVIASLHDMYAQFANAGITVFRPSLFPQSNSTDQQCQWISQVNAADQQYQSENHPGWYFVNLDGIMTDPSQPVCTTRPGYLADQVHPSAVGASAMGSAIAQAIIANMNLAPAQHPGGGGLMSNPIMSGTSGTATGGCTGTVANGFTLDGTNSGGVTCVGTKESLFAGHEAQVVTLSGNLTSDAPSLFLITSVSIPSDILPGDKIQACIWVRDINPTAGIAAISGALFSTENGTSYEAGGMFGGHPGYYSDPIAAAGFNGNGFYPVCTPVHVVTVSPTSVWVGLYVEFIAGTGIGVEGTIEVAKVTLRKV